MQMVERHLIKPPPVQFKIKRNIKNSRHPVKLGKTEDSDLKPQTAVFLFMKKDHNPFAKTML